MLRTINDLLKTLNLDHKLPDQHPFLSLSLSLFAENQRSELIIILCLYGSGWIVLSSTSNEELQGISREQVKEYFESLVKKVNSIIEEYVEKGRGNQRKSIQIITKPEDMSPGITPAQMTTYLVNNHILATLIDNTDCSVSLRYSLEYLTGKPPTSDEQKLVIGALNSYIENGSYEARFNNLIFTLKSRIGFGPYSIPQTVLYKCIINLNSQKTAMIESDPSIASINYFQNICMALSKLYPTTLQSIYVSLGIALPEQLTPELKQLLKLDLKNIPKEQLPELIYYASLFIFDFATTDTSLIQYTYQIKSNAVDLKNAANAIILSLKIFLLDGFDKCTGRFNSDFKELLQKNLEDSLITNTRKRLGLLCFTNCEPLRALFIKAWGANNYTVRDSSPTELLPTTNPFIIGRVLYEKKNPKPLMINDSDFSLFKMLNDICAEKTKMENTFFSTNGVSYAIRQRFNDIKDNMKNSFWKKKLSPENINTFKKHYYMDFDTIVPLIQKYGIHAKDQAPSPDVLSDLFELPCTSTEVLEIIASHLIQTKLTNIDIELTLEQLDYRLECVRTLLSEDGEVDALTYQWYQFERDIYIAIKRQLVEQATPKTVCIDIRKQLEENAARQEVSSMTDESSTTLKY